MKKVAAVSYTHLDVYKRQHQWFTEAVHGGLSRKAGRYGIYRWVRSQMSLLPQCAPGRSGCRDASPLPVSYTHLWV